MWDQTPPEALSPSLILFTCLVRFLKCLPLYLSSNILVTVRMQRKKGQFTSSKANSDDGGSVSSGCSGMQGSGQDESMLETL